MTAQKQYSKIGAYDEVSKPFGETQSIYVTSDANPLTADDVKNAKRLVVLAQIGKNLTTFVEVDSATILEKIRISGYGVTKYYFQDNTFNKYKERPDCEYSIVLGTEIFVAIDGTSVE